MNGTGSSCELKPSSKTRGLYEIKVLQPDQQEPLLDRRPQGQEQKPAIFGYRIEGSMASGSRPGVKNSFLCRSKSIQTIEW